MGDDQEKQVLLAGSCALAPVAVRPARGPDRTQADGKHCSKRGHAAGRPGFLGTRSSLWALFQHGQPYTSSGGHSRLFMNK